MRVGAICAAASKHLPGCLPSCPTDMYAHGSAVPTMRRQRAPAARPQALKRGARRGSARVRGAASTASRIASAADLATYEREHAGGCAAAARLQHAAAAAAAHCSRQHGGEPECSGIQAAYTLPATRMHNNVARLHAIKQACFTAQAAEPPGCLITCHCSAARHQGVHARAG